MLTAIQEIDGKILDLEDMDQEDDYEEEHDIFVVEAPPEEPAINVVFEQCKRHYILGKNIAATSFEKTLMTINYCLALLCEEKETDDLLYLNTKDQRLERLREELKKILSLMEREKVGDHSLKEKLSRKVS